MKKTFLFLLLVLILLLVVAMLNFFKKSPKYEIVETRDFSCASVSGFTFKYPVFKGLESISSGPTDPGPKICLLRIGNSPDYALVNVYVGNAGVRAAVISPSRKNINGVEYDVVDNEKAIFFLRDKSEVYIKISKLPIFQKNQDRLSFSNELFLKTVIESFKIN